MNGEVTAQLVVSNQEAYVAYSVTRRLLGPNGEPRIARLLHTSNGGQSWSEIPWRRTLWSRISHLGFPTWPPEGVSQIEFIGEQLTITHRDEWVPFEPGGESLWCSTRYLTQSRAGMLQHLRTGRSPCWLCAIGDDGEVVERHESLGRIDGLTGEVSFPVRATK
jgi:hypothetical protein